MNLKEALELSIEKWQYIADNYVDFCNTVPRVDFIKDNNPALYEELEYLEAECPLCHLFDHEGSCPDCPLFLSTNTVCYEGHSLFHKAYACRDIVAVNAMIRIFKDALEEEGDE